MFFPLYLNNFISATRTTPQVGKSARRARRPGGSERPASEKTASWAALAGCIMLPNLFGHTMSGHKWGPHEVAYFVGKGERNGVVELSCLHGSERYAVCFDARQAAVAGVESSQDPFHEL